jgi:hypothetical protein
MFSLNLWPLLVVTLTDWFYLFAPYIQENFVMVSANSVLLAIHDHLPAYFDASSPVKPIC